MGAVLIKTMFVTFLLEMRISSKNGDLDILVRPNF